MMKDMQFSTPKENHCMWCAVSFNEAMWNEFQRMWNDVNWDEQSAGMCSCMQTENPEQMSGWSAQQPCIICVKECAGSAGTMCSFLGAKSGMFSGMFWDEIRMSCSNQDVLSFFKTMMGYDECESLQWCKKWDRFLQSNCNDCIDVEMDNRWTSQKHVEETKLSGHNQKAWPFNLHGALASHMWLFAFHVFFIKTLWIVNFLFLLFHDQEEEHLSPKSQVCWNDLECHRHQKNRGRSGSCLTHDRNVVGCDGKSFAFGVGTQNARLLEESQWVVQNNTMILHNSERRMCGL